MVAFGLPDPLADHVAAAAGQRQTLCTPGTNVVMQEKLFTPHCVISTSKTYHGEQWVTAEVLVLGDSIIKHIVMGDTVLVYGKPQYDGRDKWVKQAGLAGWENDNERNDIAAK